MVAESIADRDAGERESRFVMKESASRPGHFYRVDMNPPKSKKEHCPCRATVVCWHIKSEWCYWCQGLGTEDTWKTYPRVIPCSHCEGTGRLPQ